jgi:cell division protein ZapA
VKNPVEISVMGQKLQIRSDSDEAYVEEIADFVNKKISDIQSKTKSVASTQVLILTAMNIADEFIRFKRENGTKKEEVAKKIESIIEHIDLRL